MCSAEQMDLDVTYDCNSAEELNTGQYFVEKVLGKKWYKGEWYYFIKWKDYPDEENTWEPQRNCEGAISLIREFEANRVREKRSKSVGGGQKSKNSSKQETVSRRKPDIGETSGKLTNLTIALENVVSDNTAPERKQDTVELVDEFRVGKSSNYRSDRQNSHISHKVRRSKHVARRGDMSKPEVLTIRPLYELDSDNENVPELLNTHRNDSSNDLDTTSTSQIKGAVNNDETLSTVLDICYSEKKSKLQRCSASRIELVGAEPTKEGVTIGIRAKNDNEVIRFDSKEVTKLWPQLYISFLEQHIVFVEK